MDENDTPHGPSDTASGDEADERDVTTDTAVEETRVSDAQRRVTAAAAAVVGLSVGWVERRSRLSQLVIGGLVPFVLEAAVPSLRRLGGLALADLSSVTATSWLSTLVGIQLGQTVVQMRKLDTIRDEIDTVQTDTGATQTDAETDGGRPARSWRSGGGIIGGAVAGAGFGSSFGTRGLLVGLTVGAVLGDTFEEWLLSS